MTRKTMFLESSAILCCLLLSNVNVVSVKGEAWQGGWFPYSPENEVDTNPTFNEYRPEDSNKGAAMGVKNRNCDDGQTNLQIDWDMNPVNYTCYAGKSLYRPRSDVSPVLTTDYIPTFYSAYHECMNKPIEYSATIPTFGTHRPLWAQYGEYKFLPRQRWVHNLEHGAIVMLYHPCADANQVEELKNFVRKCLYRHIITPYNLLSTTHPLALVSWGKRLEISKLAPEIVIRFIKENALQGPEQLSKDGQFNFLLEEHAKIVTDQDDTVLCPTYDFIQ